MSIIYTVEGIGQFPVDMLRHDQAYPVDMEGVENITNLDGLRCKRRVRLCGTLGTGARWQSFGWAIVDENVGSNTRQSRSRVGARW